MPIISFKCSEAGCNEYARYEYDSRKEAEQLQGRYGNGQWKCLRHLDACKILSLINLKTVCNFESQANESLKKCFWDTGSGFCSGPGFRAWAKDFPAGTKIIVTTEVVLPETT